MNHLNFKKITIFTLILMFLLGFFRTALADIPLTISDVSVETSDKTATVVWRTNINAGGRIDFGLSENYGLYVEEGMAKNTSHALTLYGLSPDTTYHFKITSKSNNEEVYSFDRTFKTKKSTDNTAPKISNVYTPYVTGITATIQWKTDEPADSRIYYGKTESYGSAKTNSSKVELHDITITGLTPGTFYHFLIKSADKDGNISTYHDLTIKTADTDISDRALLEIFALTPVASNDPQIKENTVAISWRTNKLASEKIYYGTTNKLGNTIGVSGFRDFFHAVTLKNLKPNTKYYFKVSSTDVFGKTVTSDVYSFTTKETENIQLEPVQTIKPDENNYYENQVLDNSYFKINPIFYASYNQSLTPEIAKGDSNYNLTGKIHLTDGVAGQGAKIEANSQIEYSGINNFNINKGTVAFWFKPDWNSNDNIDHILFDLNPSYVSTNKKYFIMGKMSVPLQGPSNGMSFGLENSNDADYWAYLNQTPIASNKWYFVVARWDYSAGIYKLYLREKDSNTEYKIEKTNLRGSPPNLGNNFYVGSVKGLKSSETKATIDELMIFDHALADNEIYQLYLNGNAGFGLTNYGANESDKNNNGSSSGSGNNNQNNNNQDNASGQTGTVLGSSTLDYTQASKLLRITGTPDIYAIMNGKRHHISSPNSFTAYGYSWNDVKEVSREELYSYPLANLLKTPNNSTVYHIYERPNNQWLKIAIPSPTVFVSYANNYWGNIIVVNEYDINAYPDVQLIKTADSQAVYLLENASKELIFSGEIFNSLGYNWAEIVEVSPEHLAAY